ncbi:MAG: ChaN family lipoprotein [Betaproteobacteria bacterium]|nr:ChaN family lipoprotein [Betaproteobacteria bacterium]
MQRLLSRTTQYCIGTSLALGLFLAGCATQSANQQIGASFAGKNYVLLGEVHDNAEGQRQRLAALTHAVEQGWRPAIAMEQFDRERQTDIERARHERPDDADYLIAQAGGGGWAWPQYRSVVALALRYDLPLVAANLSRADAGKIVRGGLDAVFSTAERSTLDLDKPLAADIAVAQTAELQRAHCGNFPAEMLPGMLNAQAARDAVMAAALKPYAARGAVLIAGNGHVRSDIGVPRWLNISARNVLSVGYLEDGTESEAGSFDHIVIVPPAARPDPCKDATPREAQS